MRTEIRNSIWSLSGNRTLPVLFMEGQTEDMMLPLLCSLRPLDVSFERSTERYFALDLEPKTDIGKVREILDDWQSRGWVEYETCEARVPGSFDAAPKESESTHDSGPMSGG